MCSPGVVRRRHAAALHVRPASGCSSAVLLLLLLLSPPLLLMLLCIANLLIEN